MSGEFKIEPIGVIETPFSEPAGTPIQPSRARGAAGRVHIEERFQAGLQDLAGFERIWLVYWMHKAPAPSLLVTPFLDDQRRGVFATRSPARPAAIGISAVRLLAIQKSTLEVMDVDIVNGTPLLDIKPYVPEFDCYPGSHAGWFDQSESRRCQADGRFDGAPPHLARWIVRLAAGSWLMANQPGRRETRSKGGPVPPRRMCPRHGDEYPCTCAMGNLYRFVEPVVLLLLKIKGRSYGYDLAGDFKRHALTDAEIERGGLYRTLRQLEMNGNVSSEWKTDGAGPARRVYKLTRQGERHLEEWTTVLEHVSKSMARFVKSAKKSLQAPAGRSRQIRRG